MSKRLSEEQEVVVSKTIQDRFLSDGAYELAEDLNLSVSTIWARARRLGLKTELTLLKEQNRDTLKVDYFKVWTESMAYDLGNITADATISNENSTLALRVSIKDENLLLGIRNRLGSNHKITRFSRFIKKGNLKHYIRTHICCPSIVEDLSKLGVVESKSKLPMELPDIPREYFNHYCRGYLDGDGSIGVFRRGDKGWEGREIRFFGGLNFITKLRISILGALSVSKISLVKSSKSDLCWGITWTSKSDILSLYNWLYPLGDYPFLLRKKERLIEYIKSIPENPNLHRDSTTGFMGVTKPNAAGSYQARLRFKRKIYGLGSYNNSMKAAYAYNLGVNIVRGEFVKLNRIEGLSEDEKKIVEVTVLDKLRLN